jgi:hypothetical protein
MMFARNDHQGGRWPVKSQRMEQAIDAAVRRGEAIRIVGAGPASAIVMVALRRAATLERCGGALKILLAHGELAEADQVSVQWRTLPQVNRHELCEQYYDGETAWIGGDLVEGSRASLDGRLIPLDPRSVRQAALLFDGLWRLGSPQRRHAC